MRRPDTFRSLLASLARWKKRPAVGFRGQHGARWLSYDRLFQNALRAASDLREQGLRHGDRVVIWAPNSPEWIAHLLGALATGLVIVPVDATASTERVVEIVRRTNARFLLFGLHQPHQSVGMPKQSLFAPTEGKTCSLAELSANVRPGDSAAILFTSGSTSEPKGVILTHGNLLSQTRPFSTLRFLSNLVPVRFLALSPLSHVQGLVLGACLPLSLGWNVLYNQSAEPGHVRQTIRTHRVNALLAVPRILELLERELIEGGWSRSAWEARRALGFRFAAFLTGGATLPKARELFWRNLKYLVIQGYGSTETSAFATLNTPFAGKAGSVGRAVHPNSIKIAPDGEILVRGPHVAVAYCGSESRAPLSSDSYVATGDLGYRDAKDRLYLVGRKHNRIVTGEGHNISPEVIEAVLCGCEGVRDAVVLSCERDGLEGLHAVLLLDSGAVSAGEAVRQANTRLETYERIVSWSIWPDTDLPRNAIGKVKRAEIAERLQQPRPVIAGSEPMETLEDCLAESDRDRRIQKLARYVFAQETRFRGADMEAKLSEWGLPSIEVMLLCAALNLQVHTFLEPVSEDAGKNAPARGTLKLAPGWQWYPGTYWLRTFLRAVFVWPLLKSRMRLRVEGLNWLEKIEQPIVLALDPNSSEHLRDYGAVFLALPRSLSAKLLLVLGARSPGFFDSCFHPRAVDSAVRKIISPFLFRMGLPAVFPFSLFPHIYPSGTVRGLARTFSWLDRGYNPLMPWAEGTALIAVETQAHVVPVVVSAVTAGDRRSKFRRLELRVAFGAPVRPHLEMRPNYLYRMIQNRFARNEISNGSAQVS
jgi:long-subunit acyl-CoA synthetase (AMP-forming)